jgi:hypothetical protein
MLVATGVASAAAERREASGPRRDRVRPPSQPPPKGGRKEERADSGRHAPFGASPPFILSFVVVVLSVRAHASDASHRENEETRAAV